MKLLKSTLFIVALCAIGAVSAKKRGAAAPARGKAASSSAASTAQQAPAADVAERPFSYYFAEVRKMPANKVIAADGVFTDYFENFVKFSGLEPKFMRALMNAGRCLYLPLTGNNDQDIQTFVYAGERIDGIMTSMRGAETGPDWEGRTVETTVTDLPMPVRKPRIIEETTETTLPMPTRKVDTAMLRIKDRIEELVSRNTRDLKKDLIVPKNNYQSYTIAKLVEQLKKTNPTLDPMILATMLHEAIITNPEFSKKYALPGLDSFIEKVVNEVW